MLYKGKNILVIDIETAGFERDGVDNILELGAVMYRDGALVKHYESQFFFDKKINFYAQKIHAITLEMLADKPLLSDEMAFIQEMIDESDVLVFHGRGNDMRNLRRNGFNLVGRKVFDTQWYAAQLGLFEKTTLGYLQEKLELGSHKLHSAMGDAMTTYALFKKLVTEYEKVEHMKKTDYLFLITQ